MQESYNIIDQINDLNDDDSFDNQIEVKRIGLRLGAATQTRRSYLVCSKNIIQCNTFINIARVVEDHVELFPIFDKVSIISPPQDYTSISPMRSISLRCRYLMLVSAG